jgi:thiosulfate/3-mercaptopyruvate sulfurtransferase
VPESSPDITFVDESLSWDWDANCASQLRQFLAAKLPGTLKGAVNVEHASWFKPGTSTFVSADEARRIAATKPIDPSRETVSFCNTGHWAATNWFAMSEVLGQPNVKLYAGSMVDWTQDETQLPMDNVPNRAQQLVIDWKLWVDRTFN